MTPTELLTKVIIDNDKTALTDCLNRPLVAALIDDDETYAHLLSFAQHYGFEQSADILIAQREQPYHFADSLHQAITNLDSTMVNFYASHAFEAFNRHILNNTAQFARATGEYGFASDKSMPMFQLCAPLLTSEQWKALLHCDAFYEHIISKGNERFLLASAPHIVKGVMPLLHEMHQWPYEGVKLALTAIAACNDVNSALTITGHFLTKNDVFFHSVADKTSKKTSSRTFHNAYTITAGTFTTLLRHVVSNVLRIVNNGDDIEAISHFCEHLLLRSDYSVEENLNHFTLEILIPYENKGGDARALLERLTLDNTTIQGVFKMANRNSKTPNTLRHFLIEEIFTAYNDPQSSEYQSSKLQFFASDLLEALASKVTSNVEPEFKHYCQLADILGCVHHWLPEKRKNALLNINANLDTKKHYCMALYALLQIPLSEVFNGNVDHSDGTIRALSTKHNMTELLAAAIAEGDHYAVELILKKIS